MKLSLRRILAVKLLIISTVFGVFAHASSGTVAELVSGSGIEFALPLPSPVGQNESLSVEFFEASNSAEALAVQNRIATLVNSDQNANPALEVGFSVLSAEGDLEEARELRQVEDGFEKLIHRPSGQALDIQEIEVPKSALQKFNGFVRGISENKRLKYALIRGIANGSVNIANLIISRRLPVSASASFSLLLGAGSGCFQYNTPKMNVWFERAKLCEWMGVSKDNRIYKPIKITEKLWKWFITEVAFNLPNAIATNYFNSVGKYVGFADVVQASFWGMAAQGTWELWMHDLANKKLERGEDPQKVELQRMQRIFVASIIGVTLVTFKMVGSHWAPLETFASWSLLGLSISGTILMSVTAYSDAILDLGWVKSVRQFFGRKKAPELRALPKSERCELFLETKSIPLDSNIK